MERTNTSKYNPQEYLAQAEDCYLKMIKGGKYKDIIANMANLGDYSLRNQLLILDQRPNATKVNTMNGWNFNKRNIIKGEKSIKILAPVFDKTITTDKDGNIVEKTSDYVSGYKVNFVFDISQTEGEPLNRYITENTLTQEYDVVESALKNVLNGYSFTNTEMDREGVIDTDNRTIALNSGLDRESRLKALIKHIAAVLVTGKNRDKFLGLGVEEMPNVATVETSAVSGILLRKLGFEMDNLIEPDFLKMPDKEIARFSYNIGIVRSVSHLMITGIENALSERAAERKLEQETAKITDKTTVKIKSKAEAVMGG